MAELAPAGFTRYVEPFCGSAALFYQLSPTLAALNDINAELVTFYRVLKNNASAISAALAALPANAETYYEQRALVPSSLPDDLRAARFLFLNRLSFNGLYRTNRKGTFNVPYGGRRCGKMPDANQLTAAAKLIQRAEFHCADFEEFLDRVVAPGDFVYLDPPYALATSRVAREYDKAAFKQADVDRLIASVRGLDKRKAKFVLSYCPDERLSAALGDYRVGAIAVRRQIGGAHKPTVSSPEIVYSNAVRAR